MAHWYSSEGKLVELIPGKGGKLRPPTIRDARVMALYPSVTTVLDTLGKPQLVNWKIEQAIVAALENPFPEIIGRTDAVTEIFLEHVKDIKDKSENYTRYAADFGTAVHWCLEQLWLHGAAEMSHPQGGKILAAAESAYSWMKSHGYIMEKAEHNFCNTELGYAGTVDWLGSVWESGDFVPIICDFKTRESNTDFYLEQGLQLAGYAQGIGETHRTRVSLLIDRETGEVTEKVWKPAEVNMHDAAWRSLWNFWKLTKNWGSAGDVEDDFS